ncbi:MAG: hypothetical protein ACLRWQ_14475 [Flavonifractor plautii]
MPDSGGVYAGARFHRPGRPLLGYVRQGAIFGLTRGAGREHIMRAAQESIAYQVAGSGATPWRRIPAWPWEPLQGGRRGLARTPFSCSSGGHPGSGRSAVPSSGRPLPGGGLSGRSGAPGCGANTGELPPPVAVRRHLLPAMPPEQRERLLEQWHRAVGRSRDWAR